MFHGAIQEIKSGTFINHGVKGNTFLKNSLLASGKNKEYLNAVFKQ